MTNVSYLKSIRQKGEEAVFLVGVTFDAKEEQGIICHIVFI